MGNVHGFSTVLPEYEPIVGQSLSVQYNALERFFRLDCKAAPVTTEDDGSLQLIGREEFNQLFKGKASVRQLQSQFPLWAHSAPVVAALKHHDDIKVDLEADVWPLLTALGLMSAGTFREKCYALFDLYDQGEKGALGYLDLLHMLEVCASATNKIFGQPLIHAADCRHIASYLGTVKRGELYPRLREVELMSEYLTYYQNERGLAPMSHQNRATAKNRHTLHIDVYHDGLSESPALSPTNHKPRALLAPRFLPGATSKFIYHADKSSKQHMPAIKSPVSRKHTLAVKDDKTHQYAPTALEKLHAARSKRGRQTTKGKFEMPPRMSRQQSKSEQMSVRRLKPLDVEAAESTRGGMVESREKKTHRRKLPSRNSELLEEDVPTSLVDLHADGNSRPHKKDLLSPTGHHRRSHSNNVSLSHIARRIKREEKKEKPLPYSEFYTPEPYRPRRLRSLSKQPNGLTPPRRTRAILLAGANRGEPVTPRARDENSSNSIVSDDAASSSFSLGVSSDASPSMRKSRLALHLSMARDEEDSLTRSAYPDLEAVGLHGQDAKHGQSPSADSGDAADEKTELAAQRHRAERVVRRALQHCPSYLQRLQRIFRAPTAEMRLTHRRRYRSNLRYDEETVKRLWESFCTLDEQNEGVVSTTHASAEFCMSFISPDKHDLSFLDVLFYLFPSRRFKENLCMLRAVAFPAVGEELISRLWHDVYRKALGSKINVDLKDHANVHTYGRVAMFETLERVQQHPDLLVFTRFLHLKIDARTAARDHTTMTFENLAMIVFAPLQAKKMARLRKMAKQMMNDHVFESVGEAMTITNA